MALLSRLINVIYRFRERDMQTFSSPGDKPKKSITHSRCVCVCVWANPDLKTTFSKDHHGSSSTLQIELLHVSCSFLLPNTQFNLYTGIELCAYAKNIHNPDVTQLKTPGNTFFFLHHFVSVTTVMLINLFLPLHCSVICHDADGLLVNIITLALRRTAGNHIAVEIIHTKI